MESQNTAKFKDGKVKINDVEIYYKRYICSEDAPNLVMMSGLTRDHQIWGDENIARLAKHFNVLIFDNRGTGQSSIPKSQYIIENLADDVIGLLNALNIDKAYILGHSMGSFAMQYVAYKIPEKIKGALLFSTAMKQSEHAVAYLNKRLQTLKEGMALEDSIRLFSPMLYAEGFVTESLLQLIIAKEKSNPYPQSKESLEMQIMACLNHDSSAICHKINVPIIIVTGNLDKLTSEERAFALAENIKNFKLQIMSDIGHMVQIEAPEEFCEITTKFIHENESRIN